MIDNIYVYLLGLGWKSALILVLAFMATLLNSRSSAAFRHSVHCSAFVGLALLMFAPLIMPVWNLPLFAVDTGQIEPRKMIAVHPPEPEINAADTSVLTAVQPVEMDSFTATMGKPLQEDVVNVSRELPVADRMDVAEMSPVSDVSIVNVDSISMQDFIVFCWLVGSIIFLLLLGVRLVRLGIIASQAVRVQEQSWLECLTSVRKSLQLSRSITLLTSNHIHIPATFGVVHPKIILPENAKEWPEDWKRLVLLHECAHVERFDWFFYLFSQVICAVYWWNPLVWYAQKRLHVESEHACDDRVLLAGHKSSDYAQHLVDFVKSLHATAAPIAAIALAQPNAVESRLRFILDSARKRKRITYITFMATFILAATVFVPLMTLHLSAADVDASKPFTLTGRVVNENGEGIANARVHFFAEDQSSSLADPTYQARTSANGRFSLAGIDAAAYGVMVEAEGYAHPYHFNEFLSGLFILAHPQMPALVIRMQKGKTLSGTVQDENGTPLAGAELIVIREVTPGNRFPQHNNSSDIARTVSGQDGRFKFTNLREGQVSLMATHPNRAPFTSGAFDTGSEDIVLTMEEGRSISGRVVWNDRTPASGLNITLGSINLSKRQIYSATTVTGIDGEFSFHHVLSYSPALAPLNTDSKEANVELTLVMQQENRYVGTSKIPAGYEDISGLIVEASREFSFNSGFSPQTYSAIVVDADFNPIADLQIILKDNIHHNHIITQTDENGLFKVNTESIVNAGGYTDRIEACGFVKNSSLYVPNQIVFGPSYSMDGGSGKTVIHPKSGERIRKAPVDMHYGYNEVKGATLTIQLHTVPADERFITISGKVIGVDEKPIAGASVVAYVMPQSKEDLETGGESIHVAQTDAQGVYKLSGLLLGSSYYLQTQAIQNGETLVQGQYCSLLLLGGNKIKTESYDFVLAKAVDVRGRLVQPNQEPVQNFSIELIPRSKTAAMSNFGPWDLEFRFESEDGAFTLFSIPRGEYLFKIASSAGSIEYGPVQVQKGMDELAIQLSQGEIVYGRVMNEAGPVEGATVSFTLPPFYRDYLNDHLGSVISNLQPVITNREGYFFAENLPLHPLYIIASSIGFAPQGKAVNPVDFKQEQQFVLTEGGRLEGLLLNEEKQPIPGKKVTASNSAAQLTSSAISSVTGSFSFQNLPDGEYYIFAQIDDPVQGYLTRTCTIRNGETTNMTLRKVRGSVQGRVINQGKPVPHAAIESLLDKQKFTADENGEFSIENVLSNEMILSAFTPLQDGRGEKYQGRADAIVNILPDQITRVELYFPIGTIRGKAYIQETKAPLANMRIEHYEIRGGTINIGYVETDNDGRFILRNQSPKLLAFLLPGESGYGSVCKLIEVTESQPDVDIDLAATTQLGGIDVTLIDQATQEPIDAQPSGMRAISIACVPEGDALLHPEWYRVYRTHEFKDGKFTLSNIPEGTYRVKVSPSSFGYGLNVSQTVQVIANETQTISIPLQKGSKVGLTFSSANQSKLSFESENLLKVFIQKGSEWILPGGTLLSNHADGIVTLSPGDYTISASLASGEKAEVPITIQANDPPRYLNVMLE